MAGCMLVVFQATTQATFRIAQLNPSSCPNNSCLAPFSHSPRFDEQFPSPGKTAFSSVHQNNQSNCTLDAVTHATRQLRKSLHDRL